MRESTPTIGAPIQGLVPGHGQGHLQREGAGVGPDRVGPGHTPDPDPGGLEGGLDLGGLAPGWIMMLWQRRLTSF